MRSLNLLINEMQGCPRSLPRQPSGGVATVMAGQEGPGSRLSGNKPGFMRLFASPCSWPVAGPVAEADAAPASVRGDEAQSRQHFLSCVPQPQGQGS